ncbi:hypothetical protein GCM10008910_06410 [Faecalicatena orotica]|uniref:Alpha/beta hydrolase family protein n=1 Tax=Faecalicatena orotica TaxID=1544 RepID=A0A2Y9BAD4_9FIRM|nr:alpha/beta hydrolase [Faecalicatena orotica]PWJ30690.1 alpha/beta hydrolase family protein [Faecalicatena orotica]SSA54851.1 alpha/beta hydrolase fold [Faecalicatena orotica]
MTINTEKIILNQERNVTLSAMVQTVGGAWGFTERPAVMVIPGGGYAMCSDWEAEIVAYPYLAAGFHAFVLRYSVGEHRAWPNPLDDYEQAMEYIETHAEEWGVLTDKIAVIGFSAGGHLAACAATMAKHRPAAAILGYAALKQEITDACQPGGIAPAPIDHVDAETPPCFLTACRDDSVVPISNTVDFMTVLDKYSITYECHIYPFGEHGFSTGEVSDIGLGQGCSRIPQWVPNSVGFLWDIFGRLTPKGMGAPACQTKINGDAEPVLSVRCSIRHLRKFVTEVKELTPVLNAIDAYSSGIFKESGKVIADQFNLGFLMEALGRTKEEIEDLDKLLRQVPNQIDK